MHNERLLVVVAIAYGAWHYLQSLALRFAPSVSQPLRVPSGPEAAEALKIVKTRAFALGLTVDEARPLFEPIEERLKGT